MSSLTAVSMRPISAANFSSLVRASATHAVMIAARIRHEMALTKLRRLV